jgi:2-hydroxy-6-oxonona-2,4-dienedioate hydrolase
MHNSLIENQIHITGCNISYFTGGPTHSGTAPILFIHGWAVSVEPYQELLSALAQRHQIIAPYLLGFGKSTGPQSVWNYDDYAHVLIDFINALNLPQVHVIGHSLGGGIGVKLATMLPSAIASLTLVDSTGIPTGSVLEVLPRRAVEMSAQMWQVRWPQVQQIFQAFGYNCLFNLPNVIETLKISLEEDLRADIARVQTPTLVLWGANDLTTPLEAGREFCDRIPNAQIAIIEDGYHEWSLFLIEKFIPLVFDFLDDFEVNAAVRGSANGYAVRY